MAQSSFKERRSGTLLPMISRVESFHHPLVTLSRTARNLSIKPEATYKSVRAADFSLTVLSNISRLRLDASTPLTSRFAKILESIPSR